MPAALKKQRLVGEILRVSHEAVSLENFGAEVLPLVENLFDTSASLLYRCDGPAPLTPISGSLMTCCPQYGRDYYSIDPLHPEERRLNQPISFISRFPVWKSYLRSAAYNDFMHRRDADYLVHLRLTDTDYHVPGMVGLLLARSTRQPDFGKAEQTILNRLFGAFQAVAKRSARLQEKIDLTSALEAMLDARCRGEIALNLRGGLLWASKTAAEWLNLRKDSRHNLPPVLVFATRQLGDLIRGKILSLNDNAAQITIPQDGGRRLQAQLRLARTATGAYFVIAELEIEGFSPETTRRLAPFRLTPTEIKVLDLITQGLSDREIGRKLFVSRPTVRTHIGRILEKLGVSSRLQAALLVHSP